MKISLTIILLVLCSACSETTPIKQMSQTRIKQLVEFELETDRVESVVGYHIQGTLQGGEIAIQIKGDLSYLQESLSSNHIYRMTGTNTYKIIGEGITDSNFEEISNWKAEKNAKLERIADLLEGSYDKNQWLEPSFELRSVYYYPYQEHRVYSAELILGVLSNGQGVLYVNLSK